MPVTGRKPKPDGQKRNRAKPTYDWVEVPDQPFAGAPPLPRTPGKPRGEGKAPAPARPLGQAGLSLWTSTWKASRRVVDADGLLVLCEQMDERVALRLRVLRDNDWRDRAALRMIDGQVMSGLQSLDLDGHQATRPAQWPAETRRWWKAVSTMPHCALWAEADWQFAFDTAVIASAFHAGDLRLAAELRAREKILGTTADARRDLRIRYVSASDDASASAEDRASVTAMADYRKMVGE
jgi:hypothetical protein